MDNQTAGYTGRSRYILFCSQNNIDPEEYKLESTKDLEESLLIHQERKEKYLAEYIDIRRQASKLKYVNIDDIPQA